MKIKKITKELYVASDGSEFGSEIKAKEYEEFLHYKNPIQLTDQEIIGLFRILYFYKFDAPERKYIKLEVAQGSSDETSFKYRLAVKEPGWDDLNSSGEVSGYNDIIITEDTELKEMGISIKKVNKYLNDIGYFNRSETIVKNNPGIKAEWRVIYEEENKRVVKAKS